MTFEGSRRSEEESKRGGRGGRGGWEALVSEKRQRVNEKDAFGKTKALRECFVLAGRPQLARSAQICVFEV